jgi:UDP-glucose 4-epimerase
LQKGYDIVGLDLKQNKWNQQVNKLTIIGDLLDRSTLERLPAGFDLVIHLAANARVYNSVVSPTLGRDNFEMLFNMLEFNRKNRIRRFIYASSREVYGNEKAINRENDAQVRNCESPYAASKIAGEALVHAYRNCYGIDFITLRFSNVYGMYDESDRLVPLFIELAKKNETMVVYGRDKLLDFTYIDDAISGIVKCIERFDEVKNDVFNIASGTSVSITEVAQLIKNLIGAKNEIAVKDNRKGEVVRFAADISKARLKLSYVPKISISEGINKAVEWSTRIT